MKALYILIVLLASLLIASPVDAEEDSPPQTICRNWLSEEEPTLQVYGFRGWTYHLEVLPFEGGDIYRWITVPKVYGISSCDSIYENEKNFHHSHHGERFEFWYDVPQGQCAKLTARRGAITIEAGVACPAFPETIKTNRFGWYQDGAWWTDDSSKSFRPDEIKEVYLTNVLVSLEQNQDGTWRWISLVSHEYQP